MISKANMPEPLSKVAQLVPDGSEAYLVGGTVRDALTGRASSDIDMAVSCEPGRLADEVARMLGGSAFALDSERGAYRVVIGRDPTIQLDISRLKGDIRSNLAARDFTVNAMAVMIAGDGGHGAVPWEVIDPFGGQADLRDGVIRVLGERSFIDDPLRLVRAFRLAVQLGFRIGIFTLEMVERHAALVHGVSPERVRDELYMMLECGGVEEVLNGMRGHGLLFELLPELEPMQGLFQGGPHVHDLLSHSIRAASYAEAVMSDTARWFGPDSVRLDEYLHSGVDGIGLMLGLTKLCALLHDTGKPSTMKLVDGRPRFFGHDAEGERINGSIAARLRMSEQAGRMLAITAGLHMRPLNVSRDGATRRAIYRIVRDAGDALPALAIVALADALATREQAGETITDVEGLARGLVEYYFGEHETAMANPLVNGDDIMSGFGLGPGPLIGRILGDVAEKRAEGVINDRESALRYVGENMWRYAGR